MFQIPNKFFEKDGRVVDAAGKDWDPAWGALISGITDERRRVVVHPRAGAELNACVTRTWRNGRRKGLKIPWE